MCISGIRYYTKLKAEKSEIVNPKHLITFIKWSKFVSYFIQLIQNMLCFWYQIDVEFVLCADMHFYEKKSYAIQFFAVLIYHVPLMLQILLAIVFELKLIQLFEAEKRKTKNERKPDLSVPWRCTGANVKLRNIPQKSTYISVVWTMIIIAILSFFKYAMSKDDTSESNKLYFQCIGILIGCLLLLLHLPIILIFTFDHNFKMGIIQR